MSCGRQDGPSAEFGHRIMLVRLAPAGAVADNATAATVVSDTWERFLRSMNHGPRASNLHP